MTNKYTITLSDGVTQFSVYELEQNGPGNVSTPRQIKSVNLTGGAGANYFELVGNLTYRFVAGFTFTVTGNAAGTYTVAPAGSTHSGSPGTTIIPVTQTISSDALPYGSVTYSIPSSEKATSLLLPGAGTTNYGQALNTNLVHMLENFAGISAPANPLIGQVWFDTSVNAFKVWNGSIFTADVNVDTFSIKFLDPQNPNGTTTVILTGAETSSPDVGLTLQTLTNPNVGNSIFRVLSADGIEYLRVEYAGHVTTAGAFKQTSTTLNNEFSNDIVFANTKGIRSASGSAIRTDTLGTTWLITGDVNFDNILFVDSTNHCVGIGTLPFLAGGSPAIVLQVSGNVLFDGGLDMLSHNIQNVATPVNTQDVATKGYVDTVLNNLVASLDVKASVRAATTSALASYVAAGTGVGKTLTASANGSLIVDGVTLVYADRILIKDETGFSASNNGIYVVTQPGSSSTPFILTRATDADQASEVTPGMIVIVQEGTINADSGWMLTTSSPIVVDTTQLSFTKFGATPKSPLYDSQTAAGSPTSSYTTSFNFSTAPAGKATLMVYVNGVKQVEGVSKSYVATAPNTVTFNAGYLPPAGADVDFYGFG